MHLYVLLWIVISQGSNGVAAHSTEFSGKETCKAAQAQLVHRDVGDGITVNAYCLPK